MIVAFAMAVVWMSQHRDAYYRVPSAGKPLLLWNLEGLPLILPVISFSFSAHPVIFQVLQTLQQPSPTRMVAVMNRALVLSCATYLVIGRA
jgi:amino acid permease